MTSRQGGDVPASPPPASARGAEWQTSATGRSPGCPAGGARSTAEVAAGAGRACFECPAELAAGNRATKGASRPGGQGRTAVSQVAGSREASGESARLPDADRRTHELRDAVSILPGQERSGG